MNNNVLISIEGNIGSGKTTLLTELRRMYADNLQIIFLREPVDEWEKIKDCDGITMLQKFYLDQEKYSFSFQMMAFITRLSLLKKAMLDNKNAIIITERSLFTDKWVFAKMLYDKKYIEDVNYQIYLKLFNEFSNDFPLQHMIYVKTNPEICRERIHARSRTGEDVISLEYLQDCNKYHDDFVNNFKCSLHLLDGNINIYEEKKTLNDWLSFIDTIISKATLDNSIL